MLTKCWLHKVPCPSSYGTVVNNHDTLLAPGRLWRQKGESGSPRLHSASSTAGRVAVSMLSLHCSPAGGILGHLGPVWTVTSLCHWPFNTVSAVCFENSEERRELSSLIRTSSEEDLKGKRDLTPKNCSLIPERIMSFFFFFDGRVKWIQEHNIRLN